MNNKPSVGQRLKPSPYHAGHNQAEGRNTLTLGLSLVSSGQECENRKLSGIRLISMFAAASSKVVYLPRRRIKTALTGLELISHVRQ